MDFFKSSVQVQILFKKISNIFLFLTTNQKRA